MSRYEPPGDCPGTPQLDILPQGSRLYRVHSQTFSPTAFNPNAANNPFRGGRFDSTDGSYSYLYCGEDDAVALTETLLRDLTTGSGPRILPRSTLKDRSLSTLEVCRDVQLTSLHGPGLQQVGQDAWLTGCEANEYPHTRHWAMAIRGWSPSASGFVWRSKRDNDRFAYVFFGDRTPAGTLKTIDTTPLNKGVGLATARAALLRYEVVFKRR